MDGHLHGHYHGTIPFGIWWLFVSIACIVLGLIIPGLGVLAFIGFVLLILELGALIISFVNYMSS